MTPLLLKIATTFLLGGLVSLITITNPLSKIPLFLSLSANQPVDDALREARRACVYAFVMLSAALFAGVAILQLFGISYGALRIAGGITVAILGYRMLFGSGEPMVPAGRGSAFAFFPLAMPGIAGPGALATVIGVSTELAELGDPLQQAVGYTASVLSIALTCLALCWVLYSARWVSRLLGDEGINVVTRLTGFLLICIGIQFIGSGVRSFIAGA